MSPNGIYFSCVWTEICLD